MPSSNLSPGAIGGIAASGAVVLVAAIISVVYVYSLRLRSSRSPGREGVYNVVATSETSKPVEVLPGGRLDERN
jgi:hypothetical protein